MSRACILLVAAVVLMIPPGCTDEEPSDAAVTFLRSSLTRSTSDTWPVRITLALEPSAPQASTVTVAFRASGAQAGTGFVTDPPSENGQFRLEVAGGEREVSFEVTLLEEGIGFEDVIIRFEILEVGEGLYMKGLDGVFSALYIRNDNVLNITLPYEEEFNTCDDPDGTGLMPAGWEERVVVQNSLGTGHWRCSSVLDGFECNAFSNDGTDGDSCEVWLISPRVSLAGAANPVLRFNADRRFDTPGYREYGVMASRDYDGSNFESASWEPLPEAVAAIEANDPGADNYDPSGPVDLSEYGDAKVSIAFIYYAQGSRLTSTILRIDSFRMEEGP